MAKVSGPAYSMEASGKLGDVVYARNRYGQYARAAPGPAGTPSGEQEAWREAMAECVRQFQDSSIVTMDMVRDWQEWARVRTVTDRWGKEIRLSAQQWYVRQNIHRLRAGYGPHTRPTWWTEMAWYPEFTVAQDGVAGITIDCDPRPIKEDLVYIGRYGPASTRREFCPRRWSLVCYGKATSVWPITVFSPAEIISGEHRYWVVVRPINRGGWPGVQRQLYIDAEPMSV